MRTFSVFSIRLHDLSGDELLNRLFDVRGLVVTPNPEILLAARLHSTYRDLLNRASLALPDGVATVFAIAALHGVHGVRRHPGVDVVPMIATVAEQRSETLIILGGYTEDHDAIVATFGVSHPMLRVLCIDPGLISEEHPVLAVQYLQKIQHAGDAVVLVALGQGRGRVQGKQERIAQIVLAAAPNVRFAVGVGGAMDMVSGKIPRAPKHFQHFGFEWAWRLWVNPWRILRMFRAVVVFPILIAWDTLKQGQFLRACRSVAQALVAHFFPQAV